MLTKTGATATLDVQLADATLASLANGLPMTVGTTAAGPVFGVSASGYLHVLSFSESGQTWRELPPPDGLSSTAQGIAAEDLRLSDHWPPAAAALREGADLVLCHDVRGQLWSITIERDVDAGIAGSPASWIETPNDAAKRDRFDPAGDDDDPYRGEITLLAIQAGEARRLIALTLSDGGVRRLSFDQDGHPAGFWIPVASTDSTPRFGPKARMTSVLGGSGDVLLSDDRGHLWLGELQRGLSDISWTALATPSDDLPPIDNRSRPAAYLFSDDVAKSVHIAALGAANEGSERPLLRIILFDSDSVTTIERSDKDLADPISFAADTALGFLELQGGGAPLAIAFGRVDDRQIVFAWPPADDGIAPLISTLPPMSLRGL